MSSSDRMLGVEHTNGLVSPFLLAPPKSKLPMWISQDVTSYGRCENLQTGPLDNESLLRISKRG